MSTVLNLSLLFNHKCFKSQNSWSQNCCLGQWQNSTGFCIKIKTSFRGYTDWFLTTGKTFLPWFMSFLSHIAHTDHADFRRLFCFVLLVEVTHQDLIELGTVNPLSKIATRFLRVLSTDFSRPFHFQFCLSQDKGLLSTSKPSAYSFLPSFWTHLLNDVTVVYLRKPALPPDKLLCLDTVLWFLCE